MKISLKSSFFSGFFGLISIGILLSACVKDVARLDDPLSQSFCDSTDTRYSTVIQPMMQTHCAYTGCHDGSGSAPLDLNKYEDLKLFYDSDELQKRVIDEKTMPPAPVVLPDSLINKLKCWMGKGAQNN